MAKPPPLADVHAPVLIVRATCSEVLPVPLVETCRELLPGPLDVVEVPGGHIVMWDALAETAQAVFAWLDET
jgi:pimeloyl-ACP methyl ester carboxylesterase